MSQGAGPYPEARLVHDFDLRRARPGADLRGDAHHGGVQAGDGHRRGPLATLVPGRQFNRQLGNMVEHLNQSQPNLSPRFTSPTVYQLGSTGPRR